MKQNKGITIIEMIAVIVVLGLSIPILLTVWADVAWRSSRSEAIADATFYAEELMEHVKLMRYDEHTASPWTPTSGFGTDGGSENSANSATFNDVDDFVGTTDPAVTNVPGGFRRSVTVEYVRLVNNEWQSCGSTSCGNATTCLACSDCCYKRITVTVTHTAGLATVSLSTIVSTH